MATVPELHTRADLRTRDHQVQVQTDPPAIADPLPVLPEEEVPGQ